MTEVVTAPPELQADENSGSSFPAYRADFDALHANSGGSEPSWLAKLRESAMGEFETTGFPTMRDEDWHFTSVAPIASRKFHLAVSAGEVSVVDVEGFSFGQTDWHNLVFVNGRFRAGLSSQTLPEGVTAESLGDLMRDGDSAILERHFAKIAAPPSGAFTALNTAFAYDGAVIRVRADTVVTTPIHLIFITTGGATGGAIHPHNLLFADRHSSATIIESYVSLGDSEYFTNAVTEAYVADGARLNHYKLQLESESAFHVGTIQVHQAANSRYESFSLATGAALSRTNIYTKLDGNAAECVLNGLYMVDGTQHVDHQTSIEHVAPNCPSHELYKGILDGRSHGVFNGKVYVHPEAQKTDGKQSNNNLLLSEHARIDTKPQLEIFADDVRCTHGATVGRLDETAMFYLRSRGIGVAQARRLLTYAFAADVLEKMELEPLKLALERQVLARFTA